MNKLWIRIKRRIIDMGKDDNFKFGLIRNEYFKTGRVTRAAPGRARVGDGEVRLGSVRLG